MRKRIPVTYNFVIFLHAYLHQAELSVHRSAQMPRQATKDFYNNGVAPERVIHYLNGLSKSAVRVTTAAAVPRPFTLRKKLACRFIYAPVSRAYLLQEEVLYAIELLKELSVFLAADKVIPMATRDLYLKLAHFNHGHIGWRLRKKDWSASMRVDHFFANERLVTTPLENFMTGFTI